MPGESSIINSRTFLRSAFISQFVAMPPSEQGEHRQFQLTAEAVEIADIELSGNLPWPWPDEFKERVQRLFAATVFQDPDCSQSKSSQLVPGRKRERADNLLGIPGLFCFSVIDGQGEDSSKSSGGRKGPLDPARKEKIAKVRKTGACLRCRLQKRTVSQGRLIPIFFDDDLAVKHALTVALVFRRPPLPALYRCRRLCG
jgi:hypothetical protein